MSMVSMGTYTQIHLSIYKYTYNLKEIQILKSIQRDW